MAIHNFMRKKKKGFLFLEQKTKITEEIPSLTQNLAPWLRKHKTCIVYPREGPGLRSLKEVVILQSHMW